MAVATAALLFAGKSVAAPAISFIVNKAFSYLRDWHRAEGMEARKHRLEQRLAQIQAMYDAIDLEKIDAEKGCNLDQWLWRFRDAVEGAEDVLDEVDYYKLEEDAHPQNLKGKIQIKTDKARRSFTYEGDMEKKLKKAIDNLDKVAQDGFELLQFISSSFSRVLPDRGEISDEETSSEPGAYILGRDNEKDEIMKWLTNDVDEGPDTRTTTRVPVFAIIGIGGMGKTTLAQLVKQELEGSPHSHFHRTAWVSVKRNTFSAKGITRKILEAVTSKSPRADSLEALQQLLKKELNPKKFLLILDDVWEDGRREEWEKLMAPLQTSQSGSRILLTARMKSVADMVTSVMGGKNKFLTLEGLDEDNNFKLFQKYAFEGMKAEDYTNLLPIAKEIVKKFQGCPFVTKIASGYLKENVLNEQHWVNLNAQIEQLKGRKLDDIIMTVLRTSYWHLPEHLQLCFRYCSVFPKDCKFKKDELVKMWMGSGLIPHVEGETERPEDIGERYLAQLTKKSFFSFVPTGDPHNKHYSGYYIMHDLLHDLSRSVSFGECLRLESGDMYGYGRDTVRHLWIADFSKLKIKETEAISSFKNLRTLVIESFSDVGMEHVSALEKVVENLKGLRLLVLKRVPEFRFAKEVSKHLRYISLSGMQKVQGLSKLYHLQILIADRNIDVGKKLKFGTLSRLRYVSDGFFELFVARLTSIQELHNFQIQANEGNRISSLQNLSSLRKLKMCNLENIGNHEEVIEARLNEKDHLKSLSLNWSWTNGSPNNDDMVIEKLRPPARLENLEIAGFNGFQFPSWINHLSLTNMVSLELRMCRKWESLPALGNLWSLKHLELQNMTKLIHIGQSSDDSLPPNLKTLVVVDCLYLAKLPLLPSSLEKLEIHMVGLTSLPSMRDHHDNNMDSEGLLPKKLLSVIIDNCPKLTSFDQSFLLNKRCVQTIRILKIVSCTRLEEAPLLFMEMNLTKFHIGNSYDLRMSENIDGGLLPKTLRELTMERCGGLQLPLLNSLFGLTNLTSLSLHDCSVESLPSSEVFESLTALREIFIMACINLSSLGGLGALPYLTWLEIKECKKLLLGALLSDEVCGNHRLQVYTLSVENPTMLEIEPLKRLHNVKSLILSTCWDPISERWLQQNSTSLESLEIDKPVGIKLLQLGNISSLKRLEFRTARRGLPFPILPSSLDSFIITTCEDSQLLDDWTRKETSEWHRISSIRNVRIGDNYYKRGERSEPF